MWAGRKESDDSDDESVSSSITSDDRDHDQQASLEEANITIPDIIHNKLLHRRSLKMLNLVL